MSACRVLSRRGCLPAPNCHRGCLRLPDWTRARSWRFGQNCIDEGFDIESRSKYPATTVGRLTSPSLEPAWPCTSTGASGMGAPSTTSARRPTVPGGHGRSRGTRLGIGTLTASCCREVGRCSESGSTSGPRKLPIWSSSRTGAGSLTSPSPKELDPVEFQTSHSGSCYKRARGKCGR
jgi:hypothetical protein